MQTTSPKEQSPSEIAGRYHHTRSIPRCPSKITLPIPEEATVQCVAGIEGQIISYIHSDC